MIDRPLATRLLGSLILVAVFLIGPVHAQVGVFAGVGPGPYPGGPGLGWGYPGLYGGPFVGYPGVGGAYGSFWSNGLSLYGPPIPTYGPTPGTFGNADSMERWKHNYLTPGFGWFGVYAASPRPRPATVSVWARAVPEPVPTLPAGAQAAPGGCLILSVRVPQHMAEVFVNGARTVQTGVDRIYESPPLDGGTEYRYDVVARWVEGGVTMEQKKVAAGRPGDVVRVDFNKPDEVLVGK